MMQTRLGSSTAWRIRGTLLDPQPDGSIRCRDDAVISIGTDGTIRAIEAPPGRSTVVADAATRTIDFGRPVLVTPGLVDAHVHLSQIAIRGRTPGPLLEWLARVVFPEEARFADERHAAQSVATFDRSLLALGTTAAGVYVTTHTTATRIALDQLRVRGPVGKVLMDREAPAELLQEATGAIAELTGLIDTFGGRAAVVPRFAISCTPALLEAAGRLASSRDATVMTHLSENTDELARVFELFPGVGSYTDVYSRAGLLGPHTLLAHAIHLDDTELAQLAASGATVVHCPTANEALGSGRLPIEKLRQHAIPYVLGTDVGAGPSLSMWHVIERYLQVHAGKVPVTPEEAFWRATLGGARALRLEQVGCLQVGWRADLAIFPRPAGPADAAGLVRALASRTVEETEPPALATWLDGEPVHGAIG